MALPQARDDASPGGRRKSQVRRPSPDIFCRKPSDEGNKMSLSQPLLAAKKSMTKSVSQKKIPFMDASEATILKNKLKKGMAEEDAEEERFYKEDSLAASLARNSIFKNVSLFVILLNTFWIAIDTDYNKADVLCNAPMVFQLMENAFCSYFAFEICVRFLAFANKPDAFTDYQFMFDVFLVGTMVWETWVQVALYLWSTDVDGRDANATSTGHTALLRVFRLFRITRSARALRLLRACPEFMIYLKGLAAGFRSVCVTLSLLMVVIYIFAILFAQTLSGTEAAEGYFETVPQSMDTLLVQGIFADQADIFGTLRDKAGLIYYLLFLVYMVIGSLTIANMLIGVLCEVVQKTADEEEENAAEVALELKVQDIVNSINDDGSDGIDKEEFRRLLYKEDVMRQLDELDVDVAALVDHAQYLFRNKTEISCDEFHQTLMHLRGSNNATVKDVVDMRNLLLLQLHDINDNFAVDDIDGSEVSGGPNENGTEVP
jgi:hypothetical protein